MCVCVCVCVYIYISYIFSKNYCKYFIYNVVLVSGVQQRESVIHRHISTLIQILFQYRPKQSIEYSPLCYTAGHYLLSVLQIVMCTCQSQSSNLSLPLTYPLITISLFSASVTLFLFYRHILKNKFNKSTFLKQILHVRDSI